MKSVKVVKIHNWYKRFKNISTDNLYKIYYINQSCLIGLIVLIVVLDEMNYLK